MIEGIEFTQESAFLRGLGKYDEAINVIEKNIDNIDITIQAIGWLAAFYAARDKGDLILAKKYAKLVSIEDPNLPSIKSYI